MIKKDCVILDRARGIDVRYIGKYGFPEGRKFIRWFFETIYGPLSEDVVVKQTCGDSRCINPKHFGTITKSQEMKNIVALHPRHSVPVKVSDDDVRFLLTHRNEINKKQFAKDKGISYGHLFQILRGNYRKDIFKEVQDGETKEAKKEGDKRTRTSIERRKV